MNNFFKNVFLLRGIFIGLIVNEQLNYYAQIEYFDKLLTDCYKS